MLVIRGCSFTMTNTRPPPRPPNRPKPLQEAVSLPPPPPLHTREVCCTTKGLKRGIISPVTVTPPPRRKPGSMPHNGGKLLYDTLMQTLECAQSLAALISGLCDRKKQAAIHFIHWLPINWGGASVTTEAMRVLHRLDARKRRNHQWAAPLIESHASHSEIALSMIVCGSIK